MPKRAAATAAPAGRMLDTSVEFRGSKKGNIKNHCTLHPFIDAVIYLGICIYYFFMPFKIANRRRRLSAKSKDPPMASLVIADTSSFFPAQITLNPKP